MPATVLVVEDNPITRKLVRVTLQAEDMRVLEAATGVEAEDILGEQSVDLVLQDLALTDMDGFELMARLRNALGQNLPRIIAFTGFADRERVLAAGFSDLLQKPIVPAELAAYVKKQLFSQTARSSDAPPQRSRRPPANALGQSPVWSSVSKLFANLADLTGGAASFDSVLESALASFLDSTAFQCGAAYLPSTNGGALELGAALGFHGAAAAALDDFAGERDLLERALLAGAPQMVARQTAPHLLAALEAGALMIVPISHGRASMALFVAASANEVVSEDWLEVARLVSAPIAQSLELALSVTRLAASEQRFRGIAESTLDGIVVANAERVISYANAAAARILALDSKALVGRRALDVIPSSAQGGLVRQPRVAEHGEVPFEVSLRTFEDPPGQLNYVYGLRDLSERLQIEELAWLANHDALTGLVNRRRFEEELATRLAEARRYGTSGALLALDLDEFKPINDTYGHAAGDMVLRSVAEVLRSVTRASDLAARIGGDEFAVLLSHTNAAGAAVCARKLVEHISDQIMLFEGMGLRVGASVGIALLPTDGSTREELVASADRALYASKQAGRSRVSFFGRDSEAGTTGTSNASS